MEQSRAKNTHQVNEQPLILGGHSFISQLGNDPPATAQEQLAIVETCLDNGIRWFDTTYQPERVALGGVLESLGKRDQATILAWNFFTVFAPADPVGEPEAYRAGHIDVILEDLRTNYVDCLVVAHVSAEEENRRQIEQVMDWKRKGYVRSLGLWISNPTIIESYVKDNPFQFAVRPFNITTEEDARVFAACKMFGWKTLATSPFIRGWELERITAEASALGYGKPEMLRPVLADLMLRFSLFQSHVDRVIVGMRKVEWVRSNLESVSRGPLTTDERVWLRNLRLLTAKKLSLWKRLRRLF